METPIGHVPTPDALDVSGPGHDPPSTSRQALARRPGRVAAEIPQITEWFEKFGDKLPTTMWDELEILKSRLA